MTKKKEKELNPKAVENKNISFDILALKELKDTVTEFNIEVPKDDKQETFYKLAINKLFDNEDIETKTEYLSSGEVFVGAKLQILGEYGEIPMLSQFITKRERKMVSHKRKGREEIILALQERREEIIEQRRNDMLDMYKGRTL